MLGAHPVVRQWIDPAISEPIVLEEQAIDWLIQNGEEKITKVSFKEYMKP